MSTEAQVCPTCGQQIPEDPIPGAPRHSVSVRQAAETPDQDQDDIVCSFESLTIGLPKSVVGKITAKLDRVGIDYSGAITDTPEVRAVVDAARVSYEMKKERARVASAKRRAAAKLKGPAEPEPPMDA